MSARVLIYVQYLLGSGHLKRMAAIGAALAADGFDVEIASGGRPAADIETGRARLTQLPSLRATNAFKSLLDADEKPIDEAWRNRRRDALLARLEAQRPDVLLIEHFPFGRRMLEFELLPLIERARAARPRPLVLCSVRDILVAPRDAKKAAAAVARARDWFDAVLVHGDPALIDLPASLPEAAALSNLLYTGYIDTPPAPEPPPGDGDGEIVVSIGGGAVGAALLDAALAAQREGVAAGRTWRLLLGQNLPAEHRARVAATAPQGVIVEPARRDFPNLLRRCHVSVSQAGYNTAMDIFAARARSVLVPFAADGETEQAQRAAAMAARGWATVVPEDGVSGAALGAAIATAAARPRPDTTMLRTGGAAASAHIIRRLLAERAAA